MTRTTIDIDPTVLRELKRRGRADGRSIGQVASELLASAFQTTQARTPRRIQWITRPMGALVDLEDKEALRRVLGEP